MKKKSKPGDWLDSKEARKELKASACDLSHIREAGKVRYRKDGNAYRYLKKDVQNHKKAREKRLRQPANRLHSSVTLQSKALAMPEAIRSLLSSHAPD